LGPIDVRNAHDLMSPMRMKMVQGLGHFPTNDMRYEMGMEEDGMIILWG